MVIGAITNRRADGGKQRVDKPPLLGSDGRTVSNFSVSLFAGARPQQLFDLDAIFHAGILKSVNKADDYSVSFGELSEDPLLNAAEVLRCKFDRGPVVDVVIYAQREKLVILRE